jgi:hypothetical protein
VHVISAVDEIRSIDLLKGKNEPNGAHNHEELRDSHEAFFFGFLPRDARIQGPALE